MTKCCEVYIYEELDLIKIERELQISYIVEVKKTRALVKVQRARTLGLVIRLLFRLEPQIFIVSFN